MFLQIFNWMLAHVPGFMRPGVNWLIDGLRSITNYIAQRWASLGRAAGYWWEKVTGWAAGALSLALTLATFAVWLVTVFVPSWVARKVSELDRVIRNMIATVAAGLRAALSALENWVRRVAAGLFVLISEVKAWARDQLNRIIGTLANLLHALVHVLSGPAVLAEWLAGAMWRALLRLAYAQRDRIALWFTRESVVFTRWFSRQVEDVILRWL